MELILIEELKKLIQILSEENFFLAKNLDSFFHENYNLLQERKMEDIEQENERFANFLKSYKLLEMKREHCFLNFKEQLNLTFINNLTELIMYLKKENSVPYAIINDLILVQKSMSTLALKLKYLNNTRQDMLKNYLKFLNYKIELAMIKNPVRIDYQA